MGLLVLGRVDMCVGQNQMCGGKRKNSEGAVMSVAFLVVPLKHDLSVGQLSKYFWH